MHQRSYDAGRTSDSFKRYAPATQHSSQDAVQSKGQLSSTLRVCRVLWSTVKVQDHLCLCSSVGGVEPVRKTNKFLRTKNGVKQRPAATAAVLKSKGRSQHLL